MNRQDDPEELASLYLSGALEPDRRAEVEARLEQGDPALRASLAELAPAIEALVDAIPPVAPDAGVRNTLLKMARQTVATRPASEITAGTVEVRPAAEGEWRPTTSRGVTIRSLRSDKDAGLETFLLRMEPGAILKAHPHGSGGEECYMIEGDAFSAGYALKAGDYQRLPAGVHGPVSTRGGCLILVRVSST